MGKEEKRREVDGSAVEGGGDAKPVRILFDKYENGYNL